MASHNDIMKLVAALRRGDPEAHKALFALVYQELKVMAHRQLLCLGSAQTINTTALVHEAYLKVIDRRDLISWQGKAHIQAVAAKAMRQIIVDYARKKQASKRGGQASHTRFTSSAHPAQSYLEEMLDLDKALTEMAVQQPRGSRVVELRYFGGLSVEETAEVLGVSARTVRRDWSEARAFLYLSLQEAEGA